MPDPAGSPPTVESTGLGRALVRVGDRWSLLIVHALLGGAGRFNDLLAAVPGLAPNVLSSRLKQLERDGILVARPYSRRPPRFTYQLTAAGEELAAALRSLAHWGAGEHGPAHAACGTPLELRWYCPLCAAAVDPDAPAEDHFV